MRTFDSAWLRRLIVLMVVLGPVGYSLVINFSALDLPPAWDSAATVGPAALTIVERNFDVWEVTRLPSIAEGGPSTHATSIYTIGLALLISWLGASTAFYGAHLISIGLVGALAGATYLLARERLSIYVSALGAATISIMPVVVQQAADVYLDLPLAVVTTLACLTTFRRRFWTTAALVFIGVAIKPSAVFLLPLLLWARPDGKPLRRHLVDVAIGGLVGASPFLLVLSTTDRFDTAPWSISGLMPLIQSSAALLALTVDVFVLVSIYLLVIYGRLRSGAADRLSKTSALLIGSFLAAHVAAMMLTGGIAVLPRYYIAVLPALLIPLIPARSEKGHKPSRLHYAAVGSVLLLALFSLLNVRGDFYPRSDHEFYVAAERSTLAQDLLELHVLGARELASQDLPILAERQVLYRLVYPGMGYVDTAPHEIHPVILNRVPELPDEFAMLIERRYQNPLVPIEEAALDLGYTLTYETLTVGPFESDLIVASKS